MTRKFPSCKRRLLGWAILAAALHGLGHAFAAPQLRRDQQPDRMQTTLQRRQTPLIESRLLQTSMASAWPLPSSELVSLVSHFSYGGMYVGMLLLWTGGAYCVLAALLKHCVQCQLGVQECTRLSKMSKLWII
eukprot:Skav224237  [mRNA]  locus=scaffold939:1280084:1280482:+ [translate_table: standard]